MFERRERWAARWTWGVFTMNIHSTQRIEAVHGAVSNILGANMLLTVLLPKLEAYNADVSSRAETHFIRQTRLFKLQYKGHHRLIEEVRLPCCRLVCPQPSATPKLGGRAGPPKLGDALSLLFFLNAFA